MTFVDRDSDDVMCIFIARLLDVVGENILLLVSFPLKGNKVNSITLVRMIMSTAMSTNDSTIRFFNESFISG